MIQWDALLKAIVYAVVFSTVGLIFFGIAFVIVQKVLPFSLRKEIEEDQNTALGIVIASIFIGIAMIVSAAIHG